MARKQFLINYHTSEVANMPSKENIKLGEIAVRHASAKPELIIKLDNDEFGVFEDKIAASGRVHTLNTVLTGEIDNLSGRIDDINDTINNNQTALTETFATKTYAEEIGANAVASAKTYADEAEANAVASAKTYVDAQVGAVNGRVDTVAADVTGLTKTVTDFKAEVARDYALKTDVATAKAEAIGAASGYTDEAKNAAIASASAYTDTQVGTVNGRVDTVVADVTGLTKTVNDFKAEVADTYATKQYADDAEAAAIEAANAYADEAEADAVASAKTYVDAQVGAVNGRVDTVAADVSVLSGAVGTLEEDLTDIINTKVASAYIYQGSCTYAELSSKEKVVGYVWNVTDANGNFPAGTNYAWDGTKWDALGGSIDLSVYALSADVNTQINGLKGNIDDIDAEVTDLSGVVQTLKSDVEANYATKQYADNAEADAVASAKTYADGVKDAAIASASAYTDTQVGTVNGRVDTVVADVTGLTKTVTDFKAEVARDYATKTYADNAEADAVASAKTYADGVKDAAIASASAYTDTQVNGVIGRIEALESKTTTWDAAIQTVAVNSNVTATKEGTKVTFDFSKMIIDGGTF